MKQSYSFVVRIEELRLLDEGTRGSGGQRDVVPAEAAGVGKTWPARQAVAQARERGALTHWVGLRGPSPLNLMTVNATLSMLCLSDP
ncbi:hypothetical protein [Streptosporangium subroseum]|nr:hypothetical protein [Streptosporangium subroseum]